MVPKSVTGGPDELSAPVHARDNTAATFAVTNRDREVDTLRIKIPANVGTKLVCFGEVYCGLVLGKVPGLGACEFGALYVPEIETCAHQTAPSAENSEQDAHAKRMRSPGSGSSNHASAR